MTTTAHKRRSPELAAAIRARINAGATDTQIARATGVARRTVQRHRAVVGASAGAAPASVILTPDAPTSAPRPRIIHDDAPASAEGSANAPAQAAAVPIEAMALVDIVCVIADQRIGERDRDLGLSDDPALPQVERERRLAIRVQLASVWDGVLRKYAPLYSAYAVEVNAIVVTAAVFVPIVQESNRRRRVRNAQRARAERGDDEQEEDNDHEPAPTTEPEPRKADGPAQALARDILRGG